MFAVLEPWDFLWIIVSLTVFAAAAATSTLSRSNESARLRRVEAKLDAILEHLGLQYIEPATAEGLSKRVKALADDPARKIAAIKLHREETGLGLSEAKDAVEAYMAQRT
jgi:ribosomal protein L7/L12